VKKTLFVNIFGGPGAGKSTVAAGLFWYMKTQFGISNLSVELVREYAKELVWLENYDVLKNQVYVTGKQYHRMKMLDSKVDIAISDSPILVGLAYGEYPPEYVPYLLSLHNSLTNINILLERCIPYETVGRTQTEEEAIEKDIFIKNLLIKYNVPYIEVSVPDISLDTIKMLHSIIIKEYSKIVK